MSWERDKRRMEKMSPEEREAFIEDRRKKRRARYERTWQLTDEQKQQLTDERALKREEHRKREGVLQQKREDERLRNSRNMQESVAEFLAKGAQEYGYSHFLHSEEHKKALRMNTGKELAS